MLQQLLSSSAQPFRSTPDARFYFDHCSIESARQTVLRAIIRAEGPVVVLGGSGYGKTLLAELVAEQMYQRMDIVMLQSARISSRKGLLQNILFELNLPYLNLEEGELRLSILDRLEPSPETAPEGVLVIVDEAHTLHWKLIDELRLISNFTRNHQPRVKLLLLGNMRLEDTLASPQLESFNQRLAARCYLQPMTRSETIGYVQHQIALCQAEANAVITHEALQAVYSATEGIPRLVNQLLTHAIWLASNSAQSPISAALISDAWSDLQQLPTPWSSSKADAAPSTNSIEFGELADDHDELHEERKESEHRSSLPIQFEAALDQVSSVQIVHQNEAKFPSNELSRPSSFGANLNATTVMASIASELPLDTQSMQTAQQLNEQPSDLMTASEQSLGVWKELSAKNSSRSKLDTGAANRSTSRIESPVDEYDFQESDANFFAAFHSTPSSEFLSALELGSDDDGWRIQPAMEPDPTATSQTQNVIIDVSISPLVRTEVNWFASNSANAPVIMSPQGQSSPFPKLPVESDHGKSVSFSADEERMAGLIAEQQQYDTMGVWESDPPLLAQGSLSSVAKADNPTVKTGSVFGSDFEDEVIIDSSTVRPQTFFTPPVEHKALGNSNLGNSSAEAMNQSGNTRNTQLPDEMTQIGKSNGSHANSVRAENRSKATVPLLDSDDYLVRMQQYAEALSSVSRATISEATTSEAISDMNEPASTNPLAASLWSIDVGPLPSTGHPIEEAIEDIVSQLNFSAFSVEPFSVEQIPLESMNRSSVPEDSVRRGMNNQVYMMHRPTESSDSFASQEFDDDRDLLIIEEDLPVSSRMLNANVSEQTGHKTASYSQLFARLRK